jgi:hypothetical protein
VFWGSLGLVSTAKLVLDKVKKTGGASSYEEKVYKLHDIMGETEAG